MVLSNGFFYERIQLDTINERFNKVPTAKEGDANGRGMIVVLTENGLVKNTTGVSLLFKWEHTRISGAQGLEDFEPLDLTKGEYIVTYPAEMNHEGYVKAEIRIIDNGKYAGSRNMKIQVEPSVGDDTAMESSNQFSALVTALLQVQNLEETYAPELLSVKQQLEQKADLADLPSSAYTFKGSTTFAALPTTGNTLGDVRYATDNSQNYAWTGTAWTPIGNGAFANGSVTNSKLAKGAVAPDNTSFFNIDRSKNLLKVADGTATALGLTVTVSNGDITINGTSSGNLYVKLTNALALAVSNTAYTSDDYDKLTIGNSYALRAFIKSGAFDPTCAWGASLKDKTNTTFIGVSYNSLQSTVKQLTTSPSYMFLYLPQHTYNNVVLNLSIEKDAVPTVFLPYDYIISTLLDSAFIPPAAVIPDNTITVKTDGSCDFTSVVAAVASITDASEDNPYTINIYNGVYDIYGELGGKTFTDTITLATDFRTCGLNLKPHVHLKGIGYPTLKFEPLAADMTDNATIQSSTINMYGTNTIEDLIITAKNCRYTIHDESMGIADYYYHKRVIRNCKIIHWGNPDVTAWAQNNPYANGFDVGNEMLFDNCEFIGCGWGNAVSFHDRVLNAEPTNITFKNCKLSCRGDISLRFGTVNMPRGQHPVVIENCTISDSILLNEETSGSGAGCAFKVSGGGNTVVPHILVDTKAGEPFNLPIFAGEKIIVCGRKQLTKNLPYITYGAGTGLPEIATGNRFDFILLEDIPDNRSFGVAFVKGYISQTILGLTTAIGDKISFVNGAFVIGDTNVVGINDGRKVGYVLIY